MSIAISLVAAALRRTWLWAVLGGVWAGILLATLSVAGTLESLSPAATGRLPIWTVFGLLVGCILALASSILAFVRRKEA